MKGLPSLKGVTGLPGLDGKRPSLKKPDLPDPLVSEQLLLYDEKEADITRLVGSAKVAKKVLALMKQYPNGTVPELLVMDWLNERQEEYVYQVPLSGGRAVKGGLVADFLVPVGAAWACWFIQGDYWHTKVGTTEKNTADKTVALAQEYDGREIELALELWEGKLYKQREFVCSMALQGIEVGK
jgi:hypothetical protein